MVSQHGAADVPVCLASAGLTDEVETWLQTQTQPKEPVIWTPEDGEKVTVSSAVHLSGLLQALARPGDWGAVALASGRPWAQAMRVETGWVVEVDGGTGPDNFAKRVQRDGESLTDLQRACPDVPMRGVQYFGDELFASALEAAQVLWAWVCGGLPAGYSVRNLIPGRD